ncbi:MAG: hypothetical protein GY726_11245 [Proteobacteria bacterium]|nr:hypothetical protein [Pseudomonadota bacterium]
MLLVDIEKQVKPLSEADKEQLMWDIWRMLSESAEPDAGKGAERYFQGQPIEIHHPIDAPETANALEALL